MTGPVVKCCLHGSSQVKLSVPGVSMMLMLWFFHMVYVAADWMVMPLCLSSSIESMVAPTPSLPFTCTWDMRGEKRVVTWSCTLTDLYEGRHRHGLCRCSPHESLRSSRCSRGHARSGWSFLSRCEPICRCCGSSRWGLHRRNMPDSCWWAPTETTHAYDQG